MLCCPTGGYRWVTYSPVLLCLLRVLQLLCQLPVMLLQSRMGGVALARFSLPAAAAQDTRMKHAIMSVKSATRII